MSHLITQFQAANIASQVWRNDLPLAPQRGPKVRHTFHCSREALLLNYENWQIEIILLMDEMLKAAIKHDAQARVQHSGPEFEGDFSVKFRAQWDWAANFACHEWRRACELEGFELQSQHDEDSASTVWKIRREHCDGDGIWESTLFISQKFSLR